MWETRGRSLGQEDPLEKVMAIHSSGLAWKTSMDRGAWQAIVHEVTESHMTKRLTLPCQRRVKKVKAR